MMPPEKEKTLDVRKKVLKNFLDVIILRELEGNDSLSGYDVIAIIHKKFDLLMSPGTTYALLYSLERKDSSRLPLRMVEESIDYPKGDRRRSLIFPSMKRRSNG
jgi:hypothetical protein